MKHTLFLLAAFALAGCHPSDGERCNPLAFSNDCDDGLQCIYPTPNCGVAFCCAVDGAGRINDNTPNCQVVAACVDLSSETVDASSAE